VVVSPVVPSELAQIKALIASSIRHSVAASADDAAFLMDDINEVLDAWVDNQESAMHLKCECEGVLAGVILVKKYWNLSTLFAAPEYQGRGVGRALIRAVLPACHRHSPKAKLLVNSSTVAVGFYLRLGFQQTGPGIERPGGCVPLEYVFDGPREPAP